jgi:hypothetical protein
MKDVRPALFVAFAVLFHPLLGCSGSSPASALSNSGAGGGGGAAGYVASQSGAGTDGRGATSGGGTENGGAASVPGGGGTAGAGVAAGGGAPYPYDLKTTFDWPETNLDGGARSLCQSGHYVGTYSCNVTFQDAGINYALTGPVDLRLSEQQEGEFLTISGGTLASAAGILALNASVIGKLNCQNGAFSGTLTGGTLSIPPFPPGGTFNGGLSASFVQADPKLTGTWTLNGEGTFAGYTCHGPWTATWQAN